MKQLLKHKSPEGKWITIASYEMGQYGPRVGINRPALRALLEGDGWANLSVFADDRPKQAGEQAQPEPQKYPARTSEPPVFDSEIPF